MTDLLFFDNDCLAAFLWVNKQDLLAQLYPGRMIVPKPVYTEFDRPSIPHLKERLDLMLDNGEIVVQDIVVGTNEFNLFFQLTESPLQRHKLIGKGEAAAIALAKEKDGIVASNNLRDINTYVEEFELKHITTGDILIDAFRKNLISESEGNTIWTAMMSKRRKLGANSFTEYYNK